MSDYKLAVTQARYALLTSFRTGRTVVFGIAFPVVLLVMFNSIFTDGAADSVTFAGGTITASAYFTASLSAYAIALSTFTNLAIGLTAQREAGQLKRLRGTPIPAWTFVAGQIMRSAVLALMVVVALFGTGVIFFGVDVPAERLVGLVVYVALGTAVFSALGMAVTAYTPTVDSASTVGPFTVVMLAFISGVFISVDELPNWLEAVGKAFPLYHVAEGLQRCVLTGAPGTGLEARNVAVLALWGLAGAAIAARRFRWEPQAFLSR
jgi:ABC-2 type transport system permease protein